MSEKMSDSQKEQNRQLHKQLNEHANTGSDEEFAEQLYDDEAPAPSDSKQEHRISTTGAELEK